MSKLTWADVKMWQLFIEQDVRAVKVGKDTALWEDGSCSELFGEEVIDRVVCQFDLSWFNIDNGGFTIPDEEEDKQGKPAVEFEPGEWFEDEDGDKHLRCEGGSIQISSGWPAVYSDDNLSLPRRGFGNCHPCEPDFFIFTEGELRDVKEQAYYDGLNQRKVDYVNPNSMEDSAISKTLKESSKRISEIQSGNTPTVNPVGDEFGHWTDASNTPEDDAVGEDAVGELIEQVIDDYILESTTESDISQKLFKLAEKARDQYERMKGEGRYYEGFQDGEKWALANKQAPATKESLVGKCHRLEQEYFEAAKAVGQIARVVIGVDQDQGCYNLAEYLAKHPEQPTIPQEVREFFRIIKDWDALNNAYKGSPLWRRYEAALQALGTCESSHGNRCEPPKPHPLTKVRELVRYLHATLKHASMIEINQGSVTHQQVETARRELQEYDGEVGE